MEFNRKLYEAKTKAELIDAIEVIIDHTNYYEKMSRGWQYEWANTMNELTKLKAEIQKLITK